MDEYQARALKSWAKFLNPDSLRFNLLISSLYLSAYEILRTSVIDQLRSFYSDGFALDGDAVRERTSKDYDKAVLSKSKYKLDASLLWFQEMGAIDESDIKLVAELRKHRNEIAHELPRFVSVIDKEVNVELLLKLREFVGKIDRWWILNVELAAEPEIDGVVESEIQSGNMIFLDWVLHVLTGDDKESAEVYERFCNDYVNKDPADWPDPPKTIFD